MRKGPPKIRPCSDVHVPQWVSLPPVPPVIRATGTEDNQQMSVGMSSRTRDGIRATRAGDVDKRPLECVGHGVQTTPPPAPYDETPSCD